MNDDEELFMHLYENDGVGVNCYAFCKHLTLLITHSAVYIVNNKNMRRFAHIRICINFTLLFIVPLYNKVYEYRYTYTYMQVSEIYLKSLNSTN